MSSENSYMSWQFHTKLVHHYYYTTPLHGEYCIDPSADFTLEEAFMENYLDEGRS